MNEETFPEKAGVTFPNLVANEDFSELISGVIGYPTTIYVDKFGNIIGEPIVGSDIPCTEEKLVFAIVILLVVTVALTGCAGTAEEPVETTAEIVTEPVKEPPLEEHAADSAGIKHCFRINVRNWLKRGMIFANHFETALFVIQKSPNPSSLRVWTFLLIRPARVYPDRCAGGRDQAIRFTVSRITSEVLIQCRTVGVLSPD